MTLILVKRFDSKASQTRIGLKTLLLQPEFYGDLVYKFRKVIGKNDFPYHFKNW